MMTGKPGQFVYIFSTERGGRQARLQWRPNTDVYETDEAVVVALEVPGVKAEDLEVIQYGNRVLIRGSRHMDPAERPQIFHQIEIVCGNFEKELSLPDSLVGAPVEATLAFGILRLRITKATRADAGAERKITIETE